MAMGTSLQQNDILQQLPVKMKIRGSSFNSCGVSKLSFPQQGRAWAGLCEPLAELPARRRASPQDARSPLPSRIGTAPRTSSGGSRSAATRQGSAASSLPCAPRQSHHAREYVDQQKAQEEEHRFLHVRGGPQLRQPRDTELRQDPEQQRAKEHEVDDRRNQRQHQLKYKDVRKCDPAERSVFWPEKRVAMLPEGL